MRFLNLAKQPLQRSVLVVLGLACTLALTGGAAQAQVSFAAAVSVPVGQDPASVATGDLDGDGDIDVVSANFGSNTVSIAFNNANGRFAPAVSAPVGNSPLTVTVGDFDGDGDLDILCTTFEDEPIVVLLNNGNGTFVPGPRSSLGITYAFPYAASAGDLDGDGDLDLVVGVSYDAGGLQVLTNNGTGAFTLSDTPFFAYGAFPTAIVNGDFDGDGDRDIAAAISGQDRVLILRNNGGSDFGITARLASGDLPKDLLIGDLNNDGDLDLLLVRQSGLQVLRNSGSGTFSPGAAAATSGAEAGALADFDSDGDLDAALAKGQSDQAEVLLNTGTGIGTPQSFGVGDFPNDIAAADLNADGKPDLVVANNNSNTLSVLLNTTQLGTPAIRRFTPTAGAVGTEVTISGTGFNATTAVEFDGVTAGFAVLSDTRLQAVVPPGAQTGRIKVVTPTGSATSARSFRVLP